MQARQIVVTLSLLAGALPAGSQTQDFVVFRNPAEAPREQLTRYLNGIGQRYLRERDAAIAKIASREELEARKKTVRQKILNMIGGLPAYRGPLNTRHIGTLERGDYRIEKIVYESLPSFYVTANVYVPASGSGPFPAILMPVGHSPGGKDGERLSAIGLARKGFVVLKYDPIGQGERLQYYDPDLRRSKVGGTTTEHTHANGHVMLIGDNVARYRIWDGMRGIDYLLSRKDVDARRIGCTGCSGGGTLTTYISALDERVKVAAPACYITSWQELLPGPGPQDAEQSFPGFLSEGLNFADYIELFAPKPWLSANTIQDFFPLEGARQTYAEAKGIYKLYGAEEKAGWFVGPGPHGTPLPTREAVYAWFIKWLKDGQGDPAEAPVDLDPPENIWCTPTGQVSDSLGGETVFTLNRKRAAELMPMKQPVTGAADLAQLRTRLQADIRSVAATGIQPGGAPPNVQVHHTIERQGYRLELVSYGADPGIRIPGLMMIPGRGGAHPALLVVDSRPKAALAAHGGDLEELVLAGYLVFAIEPRGINETGAAPGPMSLVDDHGMALRAAIVGKTLLGMRAEDIIRAVDILSARPEVDRASIAAFGQGGLGVAVLHAAVLDDRIRRIVLQDTLAVYRMAVDRPIHRHIHEAAPAGVLKKYDLDELLAAVSPRQVTVINPVDALGEPLRIAEFRKACAYAFDADEKSGQPKRIAVLYRDRRSRLSGLLSR